MDAFLTALMPHLLELLAAILAVIIGWLAAQARACWRNETEARLHKALHSASLTGVLRAVELNSDCDTIADELLGYARRSVPDAIHALGTPDNVLRQLAEAKI